MTLRLVGSLLGEWEFFDGYAVSRNMPPLGSLPLSRLTNFVYWFLVRNAEADEVVRFRAKLWEPPVGVAVTDSRSPWSVESETSAFKSLQASFGAVSGG